MAVFFGVAQAQAAVSRSNYLEELTWTELRDRVGTGATTVLVPIGGTEQNGPHMVLGKHNVRVHVLAGEIAQRLGNALVAPVIAYVPEGSIHPPAAHMRFAGTISISDASFEAMLEATARSFKQHGFRDVVFLGDHGGYQKNEEKVAQKLNREWSKDPACRVHALLDYYRVTETAYVAALRSKGYSDDEIGQHAGLADTSLALAVDKNLVRTELLASSAKATRQDGVLGDPRKSSAELGQLGVEQIVQTSVAAILSRVRQQR
ncbi:MAG: creatininase family protein [Rhodoferax sp.]|uniref:creatininase family protein n=1 Tax=Rhodoferax sp. TaxID=50421 RepID=UPI00260AD5C6|nr:creatininase family protein [Rhodoferax sp.]MDD5333932.1 creatininase family protein [Rhodoferax sp.]